MRRYPLSCDPELPEPEPGEPGDPAGGDSGELGAEPSLEIPPADVHGGWFVGVLDPLLVRRHGRVIVAGLLGPLSGFDQGDVVGRGLVCMAFSNSLIDQTHRTS